MAFFQDKPWNDGEKEMQAAFKVAPFDNPTVPALSPQLAYHLQVAPLVAIATVDKQGRPWTTLLGNGDKGFSRPLTDAVIGIRTPVTGQYDPVVEELVGKEASGEIVQEQGQGRMVSGLTIDLWARRRVKLYGRMIAGALSMREDEVNNVQEHIAEMQLVLKIEQSLGNCPKYLNKKRIVAALAKPKLVSDSPHLPPEAISLIDKADLFFMSSSYFDQDMDTNHRGGPPGFVRVISNDESGAVIIYPEYSGNQFYSTIGNMLHNPKAGICIPDFDTGDMLYITGTTEILIGADAAKFLPRSNLAVKIKLTSARFVASALPFRGISGELSPYNPNVRYLPTEKTVLRSDGQKLQKATLLRQTKITPTISRFRFALDEPVNYTPGQYVTFDFEHHLSMGYRHMDEEDPKSLNDDYVRTFTVSNAHATSKGAVVDKDSDRVMKPNEFEITIRKVGVATGFLFKHKGNELSPREDLEVGVKGFGGDFEVVQDEAEHLTCFIAAGVGITPLLPALGTLDYSRLRVLWSVRQVDLPLVLDVLAQHPQVKQSLELFLSDIKDATLQDLTSKGVTISKRRLRKEDIVDGKPEPSKYYVCTSLPMRHQISQWVPKEKMVFEDFNF